MSRVPGSRRPPATIVALLVLVVVAVVAAGITLLPPPVTPVQSGAPATTGPPTSPILVSLARRDSGPIAVGFPVHLGAAALGLTGIAGLELWAGADRVEIVESADPARPAATARWAWTPEATGETVLVARAFDAAGRTAQSAPLRITVGQEPPRSFRLAPVQALESETLEALVARVGGDLELARSFNPEAAGGPLVAGTVVEVPIFDEVVAPAGAQPGAPGRTLDDAVPVANLGAIVAAGLATPVLDVVVQPDCMVTATASGGGTGAAGYSFSALPPVGESFVALPPIAPEGDGSASTSFVALGGLNYLTVASYTDEAATYSGIVPVDLPQECGAFGWQGDAQLHGGELVASGSPDQAYLYLKVGGGSWQRAPAEAGSFVEPVGGVYDFSGFLPFIAGQDLALEAWGWTNGTLAKLGTGTYTGPGQQLYGGAFTFNGDPIVGVGTTLDIVTLIGGGETLEKLAKHSTVDRPGPSSTSGKRTFKWSTTIGGVTHLVWQILPYPLGEQNTTLAPPFLIDSGAIEVQANSTGYFELDLKPYLLDGSGGGVWSSTLMAEQLIKQTVAAKPYLPGATAAPVQVIAEPGQLWWPEASAGIGGPAGPTSPSNANLEDLAYLAPPISTLFVRIIPFFGPIPMPNASNVVSFDVVEPSEPVYLDTSPPPPPPTFPGAYSLDQAVFFPPTGSNVKYAKCVRVVKGGTTAGLPYSIYGGSNWHNGTIHCLPEPDDDWSLSDAFESFVGWVGDVWDFVSDGYGWMQDQVVDAVLFFVPCEQIANQVADDGKEICKKIAKTALQAALASFGIPPEIPDWESTITALKGDLRTFIIQNASSLPGVGEACDVAAGVNQVDDDFPTCEALVDKAVDESINQIVAERSAAAAHNAGVLVPPGVTVEPDPRSMTQPPHYEVTITRTNEPLPPDATCSMTGRMKSVLNQWYWEEYEWENGTATIVTVGPAEVAGEPFMSATQVIATLASGETATYDLWLTKRNVWFEPDGLNDAKAEEFAKWNGDHNHAFVLLRGGAVVTGTLSSNCFDGGSATETLTGQAYE